MPAAYTDFPITIAHLPPSELARQATDGRPGSLVMYASVPGGPHERITLPEAPRGTPEEVGGALFAALVRGSIADAYRHALGTLSGTARLRLILTFDDGAREAARLPWELMLDGASLPLMQTDASLVRCVIGGPSASAARRRSGEPPPPRLRVLLSAAHTPPPVRLARHLVDLEAVLRTATAGFDIVVERRLTSQKLLRYLETGIHIWHFVGHGKASGTAAQLMFEPEDGADEAHSVDARQLAIRLDRSGVRLVVLTACASGEVMESAEALAATLLRGGVAAAVGMQTDVSSVDALIFARAFYESLAHGLPLDTCVLEARKALNERGSAGAWATPVIYAHDAGSALLDPIESFLTAIDHAPKDRGWRAQRHPLLVTLAAADGPVHADDLLAWAGQVAGAPATWAVGAALDAFVAAWGAFLDISEHATLFDFSSPALRAALQGHLPSDAYRSRWTSLVASLAKDTRDARRPIIAALRENLRTLRRPTDRRPRALLLARMGWLRDTRDVGPDELIDYLDLLCDVDDRDWVRDLIDEFNTLLADPSLRKPLEIATLLTYRAAVYGYKYDSQPEDRTPRSLLELVEEDYRAARELLPSIEPGAGTAEYHRLAARIGLGEGALAMDQEDARRAGDLYQEARADAARYLSLSRAADESLLVAILAGQINAARARGDHAAVESLQAEIERRLDRASQGQRLTRYNLHSYAAALEAASLARHEAGDYRGAYGLAKRTIALFRQLELEHVRLTIAHANAGEYLALQQPRRHVTRRRQAHRHWRRAQRLIARGFGEEYQDSLDELAHTYPRLPGARRARVAPAATLGRWPQHSGV